MFIEFTLDSLKLETGWEYNLNAIKDIKGTEAFLAMDDDNKGCQIEPYDNCTTRRYVERVVRKCGCLPLREAFKKETLDRGQSSCKSPPPFNLPKVPIKVILNLGLVIPLIQAFSF